MRQRPRRQTLASQRLLAQALTAIAHAVFITDASGRIVWANDAFSRLSGYPLRDVLGRTPTLLKSGLQDAAFYKVLWHTIRSGQVWQAEVTNRRRDDSFYVADEIITPLFGADGTISHFVAVQHDVTLRKQRSEQDHHLAFHDPLTGLPNRRFFERALEIGLAEAGKSGQPMALLFIDLDKFKPVNDQLGHPVGDLLLAAVAGRLRAGLRERDSVARLGGDEFGVLLTEHATPDVAAALAAKLVAALCHPYSLDGHAVVIGASAGIACYPRDGDDATALLTSADGAMYMAKSAGGQCFRFATPIAS